MDAAEINTDVTTSLSALARYNMIEGQIRSCGVRAESVMLAMSSIPREAFIPQYDENFSADLAYRDADIPVGYGRWMLAPLLYARMFEALSISSTDHALVVGAGTGYSAVLMASLAGSVVALEQDPDLIQQAETHFSAFQTQNIELIHGIISNGWKTPRLYDVIFINGALQYLPEIFYDQMAEGGRLVTIFIEPESGLSGKIATNSGLGVIRLYKKQRGYVSCCDLCEAQTRLLPAFSKGAFFQF